MNWIGRTAWLAGLALCLSACATVELQGERVVRGAVRDAAGRPVAGTPVLLVGRSLELSAGQMGYVEVGRRELSTLTDGEGRYRLEFAPREYGNNFFLFFDGAPGFDRVRYTHPEPVELTERLREARELEVDRALPTHPAWPEVERQLAYYGRESERGAVLLRHGLPEKREPGPGDAGVEVWWYYADGVSYWFRGERLERTHPFPPIRGVRTGG